MRHKSLIIAIIALVVVALLAVLQLAGIARALPATQGVAPAGLTLPYPGRLQDQAGNPLPDGSYDFTFALYDAEAGGTLLWSEAQEGIAVKEGRFLLSLGSARPIPAAVLESGSPWLEVAVRGPAADAFTTLSPRQQVRPASAAPAAGVHQGAPCPHDHWGETWGTASIGVSFPGPFVALYGHSNSFAGVMGESTDNIAVYGLSTNDTGVYGQSTNGAGGVFEGSEVAGDAADISLEGDLGRIVAYDGNNPRMSLRSDGNVIIALDNDENGTNTFYITSGSLTRCTVDEDGDLTCTGTKSAVVDTAGYGRRKLYAVESAEVWHEDLGTATLANGETTVVFESIFAQTVNLQEDYHVFLTPLSQEPVLLYVTAKTVSGFTVRGVTLDGRPAACSFDYRVVAKRLGYEGVRLELADWLEEAE